MSGTIVQEALCCLRALILGVTLMMAYDLLRIFRNLVNHRMGIVGVEDFLYWMCSALSVFGLLYNYNYGIIRWFVIVGVFVGMVMYQSTVSPWFVKGMTKALRWIINLIKKPILYVINMFRRGLDACGNKMRKTTKFLKKKLINQEKRSKIK